MAIHIPHPPFILLLTLSSSFLLLYFFIHSFISFSQPPFFPSHILALPFTSSGPSLWYVIVKLLDAFLFLFASFWSDTYLLLDFGLVSEFNGFCFSLSCSICYLQIEHTYLLLSVSCLVNHSMIFWWKRYCSVIVLISLISFC